MSILDLFKKRKKTGIKEFEKALTEDALKGQSLKGAIIPYYDEKRFSELMKKLESEELTEDEKIELKGLHMGANKLFSQNSEEAIEKRRNYVGILMDQYRKSGDIDKIIPADLNDKISGIIMNNVEHANLSNTNFNEFSENALKGQSLKGAIIPYYDEKRFSELMKKLESEELTEDEKIELESLHMGANNLFSQDSEEAIEKRNNYLNIVANYFVNNIDSESKEYPQEEKTR